MTINLKELRELAERNPSGIIAPQQPMLALLDLIDELAAALEDSSQWVAAFAQGTGDYARVTGSSRFATYRAALASYHEAAGQK